jgi:hypothetical protein
MGSVVYAPRLSRVALFVQRMGLTIGFGNAVKAVTRLALKSAKQCGQKSSSNPIFRFEQ